MLLLHISDIHFKAPDCLNEDLDPEKPYRTRLVQDLRVKIAELGPAGAILVGGDIAFKGAPEEYAKALTWIGELAAVASCPFERVFVIPGNHDVDRASISGSPATRNAQAAIARATTNREREFRQQISHSDTARALVAPIAAFNEFAAQMNCQVFLPDRLYWKQDLDLGAGVTLRIHGLTSTLLSGAEGRDDTKGSLYLSPLQTTLNPQDDFVNLVLCHHPPQWLLDDDEVEDAVCARAPIQMFGHRHRQRIVQEARYVRLSAGAVNPDRNEPGFIPGYNLIDVRVVGEGSDRRLVVDSHLRQWQAATDLFVAVTPPQGGGVFRHSIPFPGKVGGQPLSAVLPGVSAAVQPQGSPAVQPQGSQSHGGDGEAAMGDPITRNLVHRFWNLLASQRREIALNLGLIGSDDLQLPEPERYGRALIRASEAGRLDELARAVAQKERL